MRIRNWIGALLCILALCCSVTTQAAVRKSMPPGSFLTKSVSTPEELAKQIESDKRVAQRYARHFGLNAKELADYVRRNLRASQLRSSGRYTTYFITSGDRILVHTKAFKAGRSIFSTPDGKPAIDVACGNPLVKSLPKIVVKVQQEQQVIQNPTPPPSAAEQVPVQPEVPNVVAQTPTAPPQFETPVEEAPQTAIALNTPEPDVAVLNMSPVEFTSGASLLSSGILPGLLTAAAASAVFGNSGGGGSNTVPEPSGLLALGSSLTALAAGLGVGRRNYFVNRKR